MADEAALLEKAGTLGEHIFSIEGKKAFLKFFLQIDFVGEFIILYNVFSMWILTYRLYIKNGIGQARKIYKIHEYIISKKNVRDQ